MKLLTVADVHYAYENNVSFEDVARELNIAANKRLIELLKTMFNSYGIAGNIMLSKIAEMCNETINKSPEAPMKSVCNHEWIRLGDPDRQSCRCKKCGEYDGV